MKKIQNPIKHSVQNIEDGIKKVQELSLANKRKFVESVDVAINLGVSNQPDQMVRGSILLPCGLGKKLKVVVFVANDEQRKLALETGAFMAGLDDLIAKIEGGFVGFDCCIATPDVMQKISKVAKKLGPRGLMPSPKNGTVTTDIVKSITEALKGRVDFKNDKAGTIHCSIGRVDFDTKSLVENANSLLKAIKEAKPEGSKGKFIKELFLNTTMGQSVLVGSDCL